VENGAFGALDIFGVKHADSHKQMIHEVTNRRLDKLILETIGEGMLQPVKRRRA